MQGLIMPIHGLSNVKKAVNNTKKSINSDVRKIFFIGVREIIKETPVDTGRARNNWSGNAEVLPKVVLGKRFTLINNMPYINKLEFGGFPVPGGQKTTNGFSTQAPDGWVRKAIIRMQNKLRVL